MEVHKKQVAGRMWIWRTKPIRWMSMVKSASLWSRTCIWRRDLMATEICFLRLSQTKISSMRKVVWSEIGTTIWHRSSILRRRGATREARRGSFEDTRPVHQSGPEILRPRWNTLEAERRHYRTRYVFCWIQLS